MDLYIGVISGTSCDGLDIVIADLSEEKPIILQSKTTTYPSNYKTIFSKITRTQSIDFSLLSSLEKDIACMTIDGIQSLLSVAQLSNQAINAIGFHGQTIFHIPGKYSLQIGDPNHIAFQTKIPVVADFRRMDIAAKGQGAPLTPLLHQRLFYDNTQNTTVINLGGISNITFIPKAKDQAVNGYDSGPANTLLDQWCQFQHQQPFDVNGQWARSGQIQTEVLSTLMHDPYFKQPAPKSTGPEYFNLDWLQKKITLSELDPADLQATLTALTAHSIAHAVSSQFDEARIILCGGGCHNEYLIELLKATLPQYTHIHAPQLGIDSDQLEALCFAWLAQQRMQEIPVDLRTITGSQSTLILGNLYTYPQ